MPVSARSFLAAESVLFRPAAVPGREWMRAQPPLAGGVSRSGDVGYTYGEMECAPTRRAMYVHIWKKAADQRWKLVLAITSALPAAE